MERGAWGGLEGGGWKVEGGGQRAEGRGRSVEATREGGGWRVEAARRSRASTGNPEGKQHQLSCTFAHSGVRALARASDAHELCGARPLCAPLLARGHAPHGRSRQRGRHTMPAPHALTGPRPAPIVHRLASRPSRARPQEEHASIGVPIPHCLPSFLETAGESSVSVTPSQLSCLGRIQ